MTYISDYKIQRECFMITKLKIYSRVITNTNSVVIMKKTLENLTKAFIGESQARNRYTLYSKIAKNEGYLQIADIFLTTADNEREHAKWLFRMIQDLKKESGDVEVNYC